MANQRIVKEPIEPSLIKRLTQGVNYVIRGVGPDSWFGPSQPLQPMAPENVKGRQWDFPMAINLQQRPKGQEGVSFEQLRAFADNHVITRLCCETRKDQLAKLEFGIQPRKGVNDTIRPKPDDRCGAIENFLRFPDRRHSWTTWLRMLVEDMLILDAACVYPRKTVGGDMYSLDVIDGASIIPRLGLDGRQPLPPDPAYQQILKGLPAIDYTSDELHYLTRNPRTNKVYGFGIIEQIIMTVNIALRRDISTLQYFTEGNIPEALCGVPLDWQPDQIKMFQEYWDSLLEGNTAARRHMKFVPGDLKLQFTKDELLKSDFDEWIARIICYAFSVPALPFIRQTNRATAQTAQEAALEEGLAPLMGWVKEAMDLIIANDFGTPDLEFVWQDEKNLQPEQQSLMDINEVKNGIRSLDEVRADRGLDPYGVGPMIIGVGPAGFIMIEDLKDPVKRAALMAGPQPPAGGPPGAPGAPPVGPGAAPAPGQPQNPLLVPDPPGATPVQLVPAGPQPTLLGYSDAHQAALEGMQAILDNSQPAGVAPAPQPMSGFNDDHQDAIDSLQTTLGVQPQQPAIIDAEFTEMPPGYQMAMSALQATLRGQ